MLRIVATNYRTMQTRSAAPKRQRETKLRHAAAMLCGVCVLAVTPPAAAMEPLACDTFHVIERGDTLFKVAKRAYGDGKQFGRIFEANTDLLPDANGIEIGDRIFIPCLDGTGPANRRDALVREADAALAPFVHPTMADRLPDNPAVLPNEPMIAPALPSDQPTAAGALVERESFEVVAGDPDEGNGSDGDRAQADRTTAADSEKTGTPARTALATEQAPAKAAIHVLTGVLSSPSADRGLNEIGVIADLLTQSIREAAPDQLLQVAYVEDWNKHLSGLLLNGLLDIGFPWVRPDCGSPDLGREARLLCDEFLFSSPLGEVAIASYAHAGDPLVNSSERPDLSARRVCLPETHHAIAVSELGAKGRVEFAESADACFAWLLLRKVDVVMLVRREAEEAIDLYRLGDRVHEIKSMAGTRTLHAIVRRSDPNAEAYLRLIEVGLNRLTRSGEQFRAVSGDESTQLAVVN